MQTTCPECRTTYRITQAQLSLRRGLVRCGHCNAVFNAYDSLLPDLGSESEAAAAPPPAASKPQRPVPRHSAQEQEPASLTEVVHPKTEQSSPPASLYDEIQSAPEAQQEQESEPLEPLEPLVSEPAPEDAPPATLSSLLRAAEETADDILLSELPLPKEAPVSSRRVLNVLLGLLAMLLFLLLAGQITWFLRAEIAQTWPHARPLLNQACARIGCEVPLPRQLGKDAVASSSLEHDPENRSRVRLTVLLANRTGQVQSWPQIVLTLTDVRDNPLGQTRFGPREYLPKSVEPTQGMAADSEWEVRLELEIGNLDAAGYTLDLIHP